jgi:hypothetical protein
MTKAVAYANPRYNETQYKGRLLLCVMIQCPPLQTNVPCIIYRSGTEEKLIT